MKDGTKKVLFLSPTVWRPNLPNFSSKYESLPNYIDGHVVMPTSPDYDGMKMGSCILHAIPWIDDNNRFRNITTIVNIIKLGVEINKSGKIDIIHSYDPLTLGLAGVILKMITGARLVTEVNGHLLTAAFIGKNSIRNKLIKLIYKKVIGLCFRGSDLIKFINKSLVDEFREAIKGKNYLVFEDYVPTNYFKKSERNDKYIFFAGFPFYLKGVDILIKAFLRVADEFPDYRLLIMGHNSVDLDSYKEMARGCKQIEFKKSVFYDQIIDYFMNCSFFVLPSRTEAMGKVIIEAMSCGKAVIASNVGGIPEFIDHNTTGYLFESENIDDLAMRMRELLQNQELRKKMGLAGFEKVERKFSAKVHLDKFASMLDNL